MRKLLAILAAFAFVFFVLNVNSAFAEDQPKEDEKKADEALKGPDESAPGKIYNFDGWDLKKAIEYLARKIKKPIVYTDGLSGTINYVSFVPIKEEDLLPLFETLLNLNGWQMVDVGNMVKIIQLREGEGIPSAFYSDDDRKLLRERDRIITQVFKLNYLNASEAMATLSNFTISRTVVAIPQSNSLLITDYETVILRLARILNTIDIPGPKIVHKVVKIENANVDTLTAYIDSYLKTLSTSIGSGTVSTGNTVRRNPRIQTQQTTASSNMVEAMAIPDARTNSFILIGTQSDIDKIEEFIKSVDLESTSSGKYHVIRLENIAAKDIASTLNEAFSKSATPKGGLEEKAVIIAFESQNSLIVLASQSQFDDIRDMVEKLDKPSMQVLIRTVIVEISTKKMREIGFELGTGDFPSTNSYRGFGTTFGSTNKYVVPGVGATYPGGSGLTLGLVKDVNGIWAIPALLQAIQTDTDIELLAEPQILATDNEEAELTISEKIPYSTISNTSTTSTNSTATYGGDYEASIKLKITPHIRSKDYLTLELEQIVEQFYQSEFSFDTVSGTEANRPSKSVREAKTKVGVPSGGYIVIGGMTRTKTDEIVSKIPWLGDIPGIGHLFRKTSRTAEKLNLYIFLQPEIIATPEDLVSITNKSQMDLDLLRAARRNKNKLVKPSDKEKKAMEQEAEDRRKKNSNQEPKESNDKSRPTISK